MAYLPVLTLWITSSWSTNLAKAELSEPKLISFL